MSNEMVAQYHPLLYNVYINIHIATKNPTYFEQNTLSGFSGFASAKSSVTNAHTHRHRYFYAPSALRRG